MAFTVVPVIGVNFLPDFYKLNMVNWGVAKKTILMHCNTVQTLINRYMTIRK